MFNYESRYQTEFFSKSGNAPEKLRENETKNGLVPFRNNSQTATTKPKKKAPTPQPVAMETTKFLLAKKTAPQIEEVLVRDENSNEFYAIVLHSGQ